MEAETISILLLVSLQRNEGGREEAQKLKKEERNVELGGGLDLRSQGFNATPRNP